MRATLHATRSYMAGIGTSGSLVAGAALLFLLASAIVAFRGWPQIATGPSMTSVSAARLPKTPSPVDRRLSVLLRRPSVVKGVATHAGGRVGHRAASRASVLATTTPRRSRSTPPGGNAAPAAASSPASSGSGSGPGACGASSCTSPQTAVKHLANTVSQQVTSIGSEVASPVSSTTSAVAGTVGGLSPQAGSVVQSAGNTASNVISGTATTAGNAVSQAGSALGGGH